MWHRYRRRLRRWHEFPLHRRPARPMLLASVHAHAAARAAYAAATATGTHTTGTYAAAHAGLQ